MIFPGTLVLSVTWRPLAPTARVLCSSTKGPRFVMIGNKFCSISFPWEWDETTLIPGPISSLMPAVSAPNLNNQNNTYASTATKQSWLTSVNFLWYINNVFIFSICNRLLPLRMTLSSCTLPWPPTEVIVCCIYIYTICLKSVFLNISSKHRNY